MSSFINPQPEWVTNALPPGRPVTPENFLRVTTFNLSSSLELELNARVLKEDGTLQLLQFTFSPNSSGIQDLQNFQLTTGFLVDVLIRVSSGSSLFGNTYVQVLISRSTGAPAIFYDRLISQYVTGTMPASWPSINNYLPTEVPGLFQRITVNDPSAGNSATDAVNTSTQIRLISVQFTFAADANAANRFPTLILREVANEFLTVTGSNAITANNTETVQFIAGLGAEYIANSRHHIPLPPNLRLDASDQIVFGADNIQAGDQISDIRQYVEQFISI